MNEFAAYFIGLAIALGLMPRWFMNWATRDVDKQRRIPPEGVPSHEWETATGMLDEIPGVGLGVLERALSFAAISVWQPLIIVGWLGFKVASKWQVWQSVIRVPGSLDGTRPLDYLRATRAVGSWMAMRFLIGTIWNVLAGGIGVLVAKGILVALACMPLC